MGRDDSSKQAGIIKDLTNSKICMQAYFHEIQICCIATKHLGRKWSTYGNIAGFMDMTEPHKKGEAFAVTFQLENPNLLTETFYKWQYFETHPIFFVSLLGQN